MCCVLTEFADTIRCSLWRLQLIFKMFNMDGLRPTIVLKHVGQTQHICKWFVVDQDKLCHLAYLESVAVNAAIILVHEATQLCALVDCYCSSTCEQ